MADLHPFFVHFPIALSVVGVLFDIYAALRAQKDYHRTAFILQVGAALAALPAAFSGNLSEQGVRANAVLSGAITDALDLHITLGNILVWMILLLAVGRVFAVLEKKQWALSGWIFPGMAMLVAAFAVITGLAGGDLSSAILDFYMNR